MAELGLLANLAGVVGGGLQLSVAIYNLASTFGSAGHEIGDMGCEITLLCRVLGQVQSSLDEPQFNVRLSTTALQDTQDIVDRCKMILSEIEKILTRLGKSNPANIDILGRVKWTFKRPKVLMLRGSLQACTTSLHLMLYTLDRARRVTVNRSTNSHMGPHEEHLDQQMSQSLVLAQQNATRRLEKLEDEAMDEVTAANGSIASPEELSMPLGSSSNAAASTEIRRRKINRSSVMIDATLRDRLPTPLSAEGKRTSVLLNECLFGNEGSFLSSPERIDSRQSIVQSETLLRRWTSQMSIWLPHDTDDLERPQQRELPSEADRASYISFYGEPEWRDSHHTPSYNDLALQVAGGIVQEDRVIEWIQDVPEITSDTVLQTEFNRPHLFDSLSSLETQGLGQASLNKRLPRAPHIRPLLPLSFHVIQESVLHDILPIGYTKIAVPGLLYVQADFGYTSVLHGILSFRPGDIIEVTGKLDSGWWTGNLSGFQGWFPSNYCTPVHGPAGSGRGPHEQPSPPRDSPAEHEHGTSAENEEKNEEDRDDLLMDYVPDNMSDSPSIEDEEIDFDFVYALHTFSATQPGQVKVTKGDTLVLLDDSESYWWLVRVRKDGSIGYLPAEYIETPTERLARLNKHRNQDLSVVMPGDNLKKPKKPIKRATKTPRISGTIEVIP